MRTGVAVEGESILEAALQATATLCEGSVTPAAVSMVGEAVMRVRSGAPLPSIAGEVHTVTARTVIDLLRRQILARAELLGDGEAFADSHTLLVALERVHDHFCSDDMYRLADQLRGDRARELLVEVAHDMRSPLGSILFLVDRVRSGQSGEVTDAQSRLLGLAYSAAFGLSALTSDLMELARGSGRLMGVEPVPFTLADVLRKVNDIVRPVAEEKGLELKVPHVPRDVRLGHPAALSRVLLNLATNACKFTDSGSVEVHTHAQLGAEVEFSVRDTGRGVLPDVSAGLFDAFRPRGGRYAGEAAFSSSGLGLAICRKLVAAMGGELTLETEVGQGSCFRFRLKLDVVG